MADKKAILVAAPAAELAGTAGSVGKLLKKGALLTNYTAGDLLAGAVAGKGALAFYGNGVNNKVGVVARAVTAADVLPTLASVGEFPLTDQCLGAVIYQVLKSSNTKLDEIAKLKEALQRMEGALARDNREPWDKHDCA